MLIAFLPALAACGFASGSPVGSSVGSGDAAAASTGGGPAASAEGPADGLPRRSLAGKVIVIDPGHNGGNATHASEVNKLVNVITERKACDTTGTETTRGYAEHAFTWDVSNRVAKILKAQGAKVVLTRSSDTGVGPCVTERAAIGNRNKADAALSVHADGAPKGDRGFHIIEPKAVKGYNDKIVPDSHKLGLALRDAYREGTGIPYSNYRGKKAIDARDDLGGLNLSTRPKVFIECGNMQDPGDAAKLSDPKFRQRIAEALADGLTDYLT
ncbi:N-acetylmuramoyl-L-alanine amidase [Actinomadura alba]|uniref:N-acetylmuramoyl-L-alanine amidase n=1 Tax=Actinomadura alba TaxID=406431 RepID=UPI0028A7B792|nr:N-acetylmuramoyl-L-alanine amidase [Actinomadura alba]